jgi:hypothetical protein
MLEFERAVEDVAWIAGCPDRDIDGGSIRSEFREYLANLPLPVLHGLMLLVYFAQYKISRSRDEGKLLRQFAPVRRELTAARAASYLALRRWQLADLLGEALSWFRREGVPLDRMYRQEFLTGAERRERGRGHRPSEADINTAGPQVFSRGRRPVSRPRRGWKKPPPRN